MKNNVIKVLHVDDNEDYLNLMQLRLPIEDPSFVIDRAAYGKLALHLLTKKDYDCILADYEMPELNGLELLKIIREKNIEIPYIFLTGQGNEEIAAEALRLGADDYFTKDATFAHFPRIINSIRQSVAKYRHMIQQQKATDRLVKHEVQLRALIASIDSYLFLFNKDGFFSNLYKPIDFIEIYSNPERFKNKHIEDILPSMKREEINRLLKEVRLTGQKKLIEYALDTEKGKVWFLGRLTRLLDEERNFAGFLLVLSDNTTIRKREQALQESEERYKFILDNSFDYHYRIDLRTNLIDYGSPSAAKVFGFSKEEGMSTPNFIMNYIHEDDLERAKAHAAERLKNPGKEGIIKFRMYTADGSIKYIEQRSKVVLVDGVPRYVIGVFNDFTEKVKIDKSIKDMKRIYQDVALNYENLIIVLAEKNSRIIKVSGSKKIQNRLGLNFKKYTGKKFTNYLDTKYFKKYTSLHKTLTEKGQKIEGEYIMKAPKGKFYFQIDVIPIGKEEGSVNKIFFIMLDVTDSRDKDKPDPPGKMVFK